MTAQLETTEYIGLRSTREAITALYTDGQYVCVRLPAQSPGHSPRTQMVRRDNLITRDSA